MTVALEQPKVITWAGNYWPLSRMPDDEIKWLQSQFDQDDPLNQRYLAPIQAELTRRLPGPEKLRVMKILRDTSGTLQEKFSEILAYDDMVLSDLETGKGKNASTRYGEGLDLALSGRWELPIERGNAFRVDSFPNEFGALKYYVKCGIYPLHGFNQCNCDDFNFKACGKLHGWCKHVCCVWFVFQALKL